jgi:hypothetical protein
MAWIHGTAFGCFLPALTDVLVRCQSFERFESFREIIGHQEGIQMFFQVVMSFVVIRSHGGLFARTVPPCHLTIGPGMVGFGQPMVKTMLMTHASNEMMRGVNSAFVMRQLEAVIG